MLEAAGVENPYHRALILAARNEAFAARSMQPQPLTPFRQGASFTPSPPLTAASLPANSRADPDAARRSAEPLPPTGSRRAHQPAGASSSAAWSAPAAGRGRRKGPAASPAAKHQPWRVAQSGQQRLWESTTKIIEDADLELAMHASAMGDVVTDVSQEEESQLRLAIQASIEEDEVLRAIAASASDQGLERAATAASNAGTSGPSNQWAAST